MIFGDNGCSSLILTITLCPIVGVTATFASGFENFNFSSISLDTAKASSLSICRPALLSIMTSLSSKVEKFPRKAKSPS